MFKRIGDEIDVLAGLLIALVVAVLALVGIASTHVVFASVLVVLALLLSLFFRLRPALARLAKQTDLNTASLLRLSEDPSPSEVFGLGYPDLSTTLAEAGDILVVAGGSLRTTVGSHYHAFDAALKRGARVRLLCPDPSDRKCMAQLAAAQGQAAAEIRSGITVNITLAKRLRGSAVSDDAFELRTIGCTPPFGVVVAQGKHDAVDSMLVKLLPYQYNAGPAPVMNLSSERDRDLFGILRYSAEALWDDGTTS
jgi:hypothetical protein